MKGIEQLNRVINHPKTAEHVKNMYIYIRIDLENGEELKLKISKN
jgi:hypothetical protein